MSEQESEDVSEALYDGIVAAVIHVAAVSAADTRDLTREFYAARAEIQRDAQGVSANAVLSAVLVKGLSTARLKSIVQQHWLSGTELDSLRRSLKIIETQHEWERSTYCDWIWRAAKAAARAEVGTGIFRGRRVSRLERNALKEIQELLDQCKH